MRKELKQAAKQNLKKHYWILVVICLFAGFLGIEYGSSFTEIHMQMSSEVSTDGIVGVATDLLLDDEADAKTQVKENQEEIHENDTNKYLGRSRGVLSSILNTYSSGGFLVAAMDAIRNISGSNNLAIALLIVAGLAVYCFVWLFIKETYLIVARRMVLESRTYEKVPVRRFLYPVQCKRWPSMAWNMFVKCFYQYLWNLTIVGGWIKKYSYYMVPYILAENPQLSANEAITLSRKMMKGHKWECFVAELSFIGWELLNLLTIGLVGIFYSNPYKAAFFGEYYDHIRSLAKEQKIEGAEKLCDTWLYEKPEAADLQKAYSDVYKEVQKQPEKLEAPKGFWAAIARIFGVMPLESSEVTSYEEKRAARYRLRQAKEILDGQAYPGRMAPVPITNKVNTTSNLMPTKSYTLLHLILMFFIFSFIGWLWEVSLHLISDGVFVNRGVLHGPWLPIYGTGGVLILIVLKSFRENPAVEFVTAVILCGCVEYFTAWNLEMTHNGQKWWDYSGYFLNLHGRICAEGLLVFGLGGLAIVYLLAPALDNLLKKVNGKILVVIAAILLVIYAGDQVYSHSHPNTGKGITSASIQVEQFLPEQGIF